MEDVQFKRKLDLNIWIIGARWFYMTAVFLICAINTSLTAVLSKKLAFLGIFSMAAVMIFANAFLYYTVDRIKNSQAKGRLQFITIGQLGMELAIFMVIMQFCDSHIVNIFFVIPIISSSLIFGLRGAVIVAVISLALVNISIFTHYFNFLFDNFNRRPEFTHTELSQFYQQTMFFIQTILTSSFYIIIAFFIGYGARVIFKREHELVDQAAELRTVNEYRENELNQLDKTTKLLVKRDTQLTIINKELDKKVEELENSQKSMFNAFADLKKARAKSDEETRKTVAMIANFIDPIIVIDKGNRINIINPAAMEIFGLIADDIGKLVSSNDNYSMLNFKSIIKKDFLVKTSQELKSGNLMEEEVTINFNDQELTYKVITEKILDPKGEYMGIMKIFYNLTREKMIDKLKSEFISIAAHQLRTPLAAIKWVIKMILDGDAGKLNEEQYSLLAKGYESNERIINLVNDMLNVSRIEEGRFGYSFSNSNFEEVLDIVLDSLENRLKQKSIKVVKVITKKLPPVYMDKDKMILVLQNLIENAVKYTPENGTIEIGAECGKEFLKFRVKDNGVGIPAKDQAKLFSKFFRAANVIRLQTEGSGLGLFMVKNIIGRHGGDITFNSEEGKGTEFVFTIPIK